MVYSAPAARRQVLSNTKLLLQYLNGRNTILARCASALTLTELCNCSDRDIDSDIEQHHHAFLYIRIICTVLTDLAVLFSSHLVINKVSDNNHVCYGVCPCSGAEVVNHMRGPQDAVQLGLFLGVPTSKVSLAAGYCSSDERRQLLAACCLLLAACLPFALLYWTVIECSAATLMQLYACQA